MFGILIARGIAGSIGTLISDVYGVAQKAEGVTADRGCSRFALLIGVVHEHDRGVIPARNAARVDPVQALQKGKYQVLTAGENRVRRLARHRCRAVWRSICLDLSAAHRALFYIGYMLIVVAALLLTPTACSLLAKALRPLLQWLRPVEGALAADSLIQAPRRTSARRRADAVAGAGGRVRRHGARQLHDHRTGSTSRSIPTSSSCRRRNSRGRDFRFPPRCTGELATVPGVARVQGCATRASCFDGGP